MDTIHTVSSLTLTLTLTVITQYINNNQSLIIDQSMMNEHDDDQRS